MSAVRAPGGPARLAAVLDVARLRARAAGRPVLVSVVERAPLTDPLAALEAVERAALSDRALAGQVAAGRTYWTRPADGFALAAVGAAAELAGEGVGRFEAVARAWAALRDDATVDDPSDGAPGAGPVLVGGFAFAPEGPRAAHWRGFPSALLTLPRLQIAVQGAACWTTTNLLVGEDGRPDVDPAVLARLRAAAVGARTAARNGAGAAPRNGAAPGALAVADVIPAAAWRATVGDAVRSVRAGAFEKVVLARAVHAAAARLGADDSVANGSDSGTAGGRAFDVGSALRHLRAAHPDCYVFACWRGDGAFVGASPERLVRLDGRDVRASSLAGSAPRGATPEEDAARAAALLASAKDRAEHEVVRRVLCAGLGELCDDVIAPAAPSLLTLGNVHHLLTAVRARLRPGHSLLDLIARLHPTPAVGGAPREAALQFLRAREQLDRGWYAAPVGWVGRDGGEFAVGLRSALVRGGEAWLFAGCGVVADSDPDAEYAESLLKLRPMEQALAAGLGGQ